ncbi:MAG: homoserine dehydrogenase [Limisphaerales bacterium]
MRQVNLALIGAGTVGGGVVQALQRHGPRLAARLGVRFHLAKVAVRDPRRARDFSLPAGVVTRDWREAALAPGVDIVVEVMGGTTTARDVARATLGLGRPLVTANKALLSAHGEELFSLAAAHGTNLHYEASVAGGIPIIKVLRESLVGNRVTRLFGILNGTCNYILTRMAREGADFAAVLADAQRLGYAEADPSLDVDGLDAMHKAGILASLAHGFWVDPRQIHVQGIRGVTALDMRFVAQLGYTIKLLGVVKALNREKPGGRGGGRISVTVEPTLIPNSHVLAGVGDVFNAVFVRGDIVGDTLHYGRGAGRDATASSVLSDLADAALDLKCGARNRIPAFVAHDRDGAVVPAEKTTSSFYLRLDVVDRPGVLARIAAVLARARIGISSVIQPEGHEGAHVPLVLMLHDAPRAAMHRALEQIRRLPSVGGQPALFPVESFS